ncbi:secreted protein [Beggiatoa sp. PS]|nr:secreted protein [Beggiatoa sp. PS]
MILRRFNFYALALTCSFLSSQVISANVDIESDKQQWSYNLAQPLPPGFKGYVLESDSDPNMMRDIGKLINIPGGKDILNGRISITEQGIDMTTVEFVLSNPMASGNRTSTTFKNSTFSVDESVITTSDRGRSTTNEVDIDITRDEKSGRYIRIIVERLTSVQTRLLDATAPIVDQNSLLMLMRGANRNPGAYHSKPVYLFIKGLIRKSKIAYKGRDTLRGIKVHRFDFNREGRTMGTIWVEAKGVGNPRRFEFGKLRYNVEVAR